MLIDYKYTKCAVVFCLTIQFIIVIMSGVAHSGTITLSTNIPYGTVNPGSLLPVTVIPDADVTIEKLTLFTPNGAIDVTGPPYASNIAIPDDVAGRYSIVAVARTTTNLVLYDTLTSIIKPIEALDSLDLDPLQWTLKPGNLAQITVYGVYSDGVRRRLQDMGAGTIFSSSDPGVATVDESGNIQARKQGYCLINVKNGMKQAQVPVNVVPTIGSAAGPSACAGGPYKGVTLVTLSLDANCSVTPGPKLVKYEWDWNNDGTYDEESTSATISHMWSAPYEGMVRLRVTDESGASSIGDALVQIQPRTSVSSSGAYFIMDGYRGVVTANAAYPAGSGTPGGWVRLNYRNSTTTVNLVSTSIQALDIGGQTAGTIKGTCTVNGQTGYSFVMTITDGGSPGTKKDILGIDIVKPDGSYYFGVPQRTLSGGDLLVSVK